MSISCVSFTLLFDPERMSSVYFPPSICMPIKIKCNVRARTNYNEFVTDCDEQ